jgi:hypothetical protein
VEDSHCSTDRMFNALALAHAAHTSMYRRDHVS